MASVTWPISLTAILVSSMLCAAPTFADGVLAREVQFDIPRQPLEDALLSFSKQAGVQLLVDSRALEGMQTDGVSGRFVARDALSRLLRSTGLEANSLGETVRVRLREKERHVPAASSTTPAAPPQKSSEPPATQGEKPEAGELTEYRVTTPEVLIVGSRSMNVDIRRTRDDVQPYVVFDREQIERSQAVDLEDFFKQQLPMNTANVTTAQLSTTPARFSGSINLRGLGANQTLILVDGQRIPGTTIGGDVLQPDISGIPLSSIERIEVLPATASGIYGGGATGGVINIIRKQNYQGLELTGIYGNTFDTDVGRTEYDVTGGWNFAGRTNIAIAGSYSKDNPLLISDRDFSDRSRALYIANNPTALATASAPPSSVTANVCAGRRLFGSILQCSGLPLVLDNGQALGASITTVPEGYPGPASDGGAALANGAGHYNLAVPRAGTYLLRASTKKSGSLNVQHQFSNALRAFMDLSDNQIDSDLSTSGNFFAQSLFLPANDPNNPFQQDIVVATQAPPGLRVPGHAKSQITRAVGGLTIFFGRSWAANLAYSWSRSRSDWATSQGSTIAPPLSPEGRALLAAHALQDLAAHPVDVSQYVARLPNVFGGPFDVIDTSTSLRVSGSLWDMPGGAIGLTALIEHRREKAHDAFQEDLTSPLPFSFYPERFQEIDSYYLESRVPLIGHAQAQRFIDSLELLASVRRDEYKTVSTLSNSVSAATREGPFPESTYFTNKVSSTDYMAGLRYSPTPDLVLRTSVGTGLLPPSLIQITPSVTEQTLALPLEAINPPDPLRGNTPLSVPRMQVSLGNPNLQPETSKSWSAGLILTPRAVQGLRLSIDYTRIRKADEIFFPALPVLVWVISTVLMGWKPCKKGVCV
jgi:outer membrane receptor protein involved in Fe transport